jgi:hypothetical protein
MGCIPDYLSDGRGASASRMLKAAPRSPFRSNWVGCVPMIKRRRWSCSSRLISVTWTKRSFTSSLYEALAALPSITRLWWQQSRQGPYQGRRLPAPGTPPDRSVFLNRTASLRQRSYLWNAPWPHLLLEAADAFPARYGFAPRGILLKSPLQ